APLGAIFSAAIGYAFGARLSKDIGGWQVICWALVLAFPFILIPAIIYTPETLSGIPVEGYAR
ncbi:MAG: EamA/RhaT family transporter, partial [Proteobacteria bacterium]|nr:EamA/RhaT family transporter [Pseudomonadota bacterium]